jgi:hypothetical protein
MDIQESNGEHSFQGSKVVQCVPSFCFSNARLSERKEAG